MKHNRSFLLGSISILILVLFLETIARLAMYTMGFSFRNPNSALKHKFYPEIKPIIDTKITANDGFRDVLILGGSVVSSEFSQMDSRLQKLLNADSTKNKPQVRVFNAARPSHTSLDNLIKYRYLADKHFDLVIYYEAINENRFNNIAKTNFSPNYQHILWYYDLELVQQHSEMNFTVLPYLIHKSVGLLAKKIRGTILFDPEKVRSEQIVFGKDIKTAEPFANNLAQITALAKQRDAHFLPVTYALYFPKSVEKKGAYAGYDEFTVCPWTGPLGLWGAPANVQEGVKQHNLALKKVAATNGLAICDMDSLMPRQKQYYCDLCHLTPKGAEVFVGLLTKKIKFKE